ncbi:MAG: DnaJ domain-containing protein [Candidatus Krumholzibacteriia bacterium]
MAKSQPFVDYYRVLQVWPTASEEQIKKAYFKLAKLHHPDVAKGSGEDEKSSVDFKLINEAYAALSDPTKRREFDESLKRHGGGGGQAVQEKDVRSAQLAYEQARTAMKHNRYDKAVVLLKSAVKYDGSNPAYHSWYGFALAALNTRLHEARDVCKKALEMEFYNADYHANLGFVYHQAGLKSTANECFREAMKWDPEHPIATKYLHSSEAPNGSGINNVVRSVVSLVGGVFGKKTPTET